MNIKRFCYTVGVVLVSACSNGPQEPAPSIDPNLDISASKTFAAPSLLTYNSCKELNDDLKKAALSHMHTHLAMRLKNPPDFAAKDSATGAAPEMMNGQSQGGGGFVEGLDFSGTNNQEKGIDEADIIKVDGKFFYVLNKSSLEIVDIPAIGKLAKASVVNLSTPGQGLLLVDDNAYVFARESSHQEGIFAQSIALPSSREYYGSDIRIDHLDLSPDRRNPTLKNSYYFEGEFVAARKIGNQIHVATYFAASIPDLELYPSPMTHVKATAEEKKRLWIENINNAVKHNEKIIENFDFLNLLPSEITVTDNKSQRAPITDADCANTFTTADGSSLGFLSLITIDTKENQMKVERVRGNRPTVYASDKQFILASNEHEPWWFFGNDGLKEQTTIHRFDLGENLPTYKDSVQVPGTLHNSFSISEYNDYLRVATTTTRRQHFPYDGARMLDENHLFVIGEEGGKLNIVASIEGLAPGERIWSARFSKDKGFLTTFERVDPLFTLDLKDPKHPKVAGALKIPGVSTYLQDIGDNHLLAVGYGGDEDGLDFQTTVSLFDVSDFKNPKLADTLKFSIAENLNNSWSKVSSEANNTHLAVNYFAPVAMTAIPLNTDRFIENPLDPSGGQYEYISKLTLVNTQVGQKLSVHGNIDHSQFYNETASWERRPPQIRRSYFVGDHVYAISPKVITATRLSDMAMTATYKFH